MSVDPEPRQRTVAELLAENGGAQSGRRRRRRAADDEDGPIPGPPDDGRSAPPAPPQGGAGAPPPHHGDGQGVHGRFGGEYPPEPQGPPRNGHGSNGHAANGLAPNGYSPNGRPGPNGYAADGYAPYPDHGDPVGAGPSGNPPPRGWAAPPGQAPAGPPPARRGLEQSPPGGVPQTPGPYGPADPRPPEPGPDAPTGAFDARPPAPAADGAPGAFGGPPDTEGGPPTQLGAPPLDDDALDDFDQRAWTGEMADEPDTVAATAPRRAAAPSDGGPPTRAGFAPDDPDEIDDGYEDHGELAAGVEDDPDEFRRGGRRGRRSAVAGLDDEDLPDDMTGDSRAAGTGQAWAMVIAQWVGGAIVGAGVWVGFRYLWYSLPVVALSLAVVLTVGLVLGVRALLRNDDLRTTMFAVLVGLLLTVSPALLVLLDR